MTDIALESYNLERQVLGIARNKDFTETQRDAETQRIYNAMGDLNLKTGVKYIKSIDNGNDTETDVQVINDFISTNDTKFYNQLKENIVDLSNQWKIPDIEIKCGEENCDTEYKSKIDLDYSNFFGLQFLHSRNLIS